MTLRACGKNPVHMGSAAVRAQLVIAAYRTGTELIEDVIGLSQLKPGGLHPANAPVPASGHNIVPATPASCPGWLDQLGEIVGASRRERVGQCEWITAGDVALKKTKQNKKP